MSSVCEGVFFTSNSSLNLEAWELKFCRKTPRINAKNNYQMLCVVNFVKWLLRNLVPRQSTPCYITASFFLPALAGKVWCARGCTSLVSPQVSQQGKVSWRAFCKFQSKFLNRAKWVYMQNFSLLHPNWGQSSLNFSNMLCHHTLMLSSDHSTALAMSMKNLPSSVYYISDQAGR